MDRSLAQEVWSRAAGMCEYCHIPHVFFRSPFQIDHIIARQHRGETVSENLALACFRCNLHKGPNLAGIDPQTNDMIRLFHPRLDYWNDHFQWLGTELIGITSVGRATIEVLDINHSDYIAIRRSLIDEGVFP
jgi:hypothetical protein